MWETSHIFIIFSKMTQYYNLNKNKVGNQDDSGKGVVKLANSVRSNADIFHFFWNLF